VVIIHGSPKSFLNDKVLRLEVTEVEDLKFLADEYENNRDLDFWTEPYRLGMVDVRVTPEVYPLFTQKLNERGILFEIMITNVQELVDSQMQRDYTNTTSPQAFSLTQYNEWQDIQDYMNQFASDNPTMANVVTVGRSNSGRDIKAVRITSGGSRKPYVIWVQAGIHAREWIAPATCLWIMTNSLDEFISDWAPIYQQAEVYWLPNLNPDGYIYTRTTDRMWRKTRRANSGSTCVGTDPNRNYPVGYGRNDGSSNNPCSETYRGPNYYSEPEIRTTTQTLTNIAASQTVVGFMDLHSYSQLWLAPWGYITTNTQHASQQNSLGQAATAALRSWYGTNYVYGPIAQVLYTASGGSVDWAYGDLGIIHSYTPELRDTGSYGFLLPASQIRPSGEETNAALVVWAQRSLSFE
jgi:murein tripeptide amidase MpaA